VVTKLPVCLEEDGRPQVFILVPPVAGAGGAAASTEDALVETIQLVPILLALVELPASHTAVHHKTYQEW
jgi:hypothetical protein